MKTSSSKKRNLSSGLMAFKQIVEGTSAFTGKDFFRSLVKSLAQTLDTHAVWITEYLQDEERLRSLAFWLEDDYVNEYEYFIVNTPCEPVVRNKDLYHVPENVLKLHPDDPDLEPLGAVSYLGIALKDDAGNVLGHLALLDNKPMDEIPEAFAIFKIFAARAEAELRRLQVEKKLIENELKLSRLVNGTMDALVEVNQKLTIIQSNLAAKKAFNIDENSFSGKQLNKFLDLKSFKKVLDYVGKLNSQDNTLRSNWIQGQLTCIPERGDPFPAEATISSYSSNGSNFYALFFRSIRDKVKAEETIKSLSIETTLLKEKIHELHFDSIIGESPKMISALTLIQQVAPTDSTVLIRGETGTGKELFAQAIHKLSKRKDKPLITINCAAIPIELVESELFGHKKGAFTGATNDRKGRFSLANHGTIFLDEMGELPLNLQAKLLRVLQEGQFEPVGSSVTENVDVRVIAATNRDLQNMVDNKKFREDLFYRLNVFPVYIPPLRERASDVILLAEAFIQKYCKRTGDEICRLDSEDHKAMMEYKWPGNVRELQNIIERALIVKMDNNINLSALLPTNINKATQNQEVGNQILTEKEMRILERENIISALKHTNGKIYGSGGAAELLQLPPTTLSSRIGKLKIKSKN